MTNFIAWMIMTIGIVLAVLMMLPILFIMAPFIIAIIVMIGILL
jgi:hypothetical protein